MDREHGLGCVYDGVQPQLGPGLRRGDHDGRSVRGQRHPPHRHVPQPGRAERSVILTTAAEGKVGVVAATYGLNGFVTPEDQWWSVSQTTEIRDDLLDQASRARTAGADIVVAHARGTEYDHLPNADQVSLADALTASSNVDLVLGEHAHVVQPITKVHGKWVVYGMGNQIAQQDPAQPRTYEGITVKFTFTERRSGRFAVTRAAYAPIGWNLWQPGSPIRVVRLKGAAADVVTSYVEALGAQPGLHRL